jgi:predicted nucleic acid-binding protein
VIVADCTLIAQLVIHTRESEVAEQVASLDPEWIVPPLWRSELRNVLRTHVVESGLPLESAFERMSIAEERFGPAEHIVLSRDVLAIATKSRCSAYDAEYVSLAREFGIPLVTSDKRLWKLFPKLAMSPLEFLSELSGGA